MSSNRRGLLVVNPNCRQGGTDISEVCEHLRNSGIELLEASPESAAACRELIGELADNIDCVILGGGDGTLHHTVDALRETGLPLGVLPLGTANDFARTMGIPDDPIAAADVIIAGNIRKIDLGYANDVSFLNVAGIGIGSEVTKQLDSSAKSAFGVLAYPVSFLGAWRNNRSFTVKLAYDGAVENFKAIELKIANGKYYGGGMSILDDATIDNNQLAMLAIKPANFYELVKLAPLLRAGWVREHNRFIIREAKEFTVNTRKTMPVTTDGELTTETPVKFRVEHKALKVFAPPISEVTT